MCVCVIYSDILRLITGPDIVAVYTALLENLLYVTKFSTIFPFYMTKLFFFTKSFALTL